MRDELKEKAERGVIDNMLHTAQAALAVGAGAAFLYRNGGRKFLSEASSVSSRVLGDINKDLDGIGAYKGRIHTNEVRNVYNRAFKGEDSHYKKAREVSENGGGRLRINDQQSLYGRFYENFTKGTKKNINRAAQNAFEHNKAIVPLANEYAQRLGSTAVEQRFIREFTEFSYRNTDIGAILNKREELKLQNVIKNDQIEEFLKRIKESKQEIAVEKERFGRQLEGSSDQMQEKTFGLENLLALKKKQKEENTWTGDRPITFEELIDNKERFVGQKVTFELDDRDTPITEEAVEFAERLVEHARKVNKERGDEAAEVMKSLYSFNSVRVKDDELFNLTDTHNATDRFLDQFASTMPGKILKVRDMRESTKQPAFHLFSPSISKADPFAAALLKTENAVNPFTLDEMFVRLSDEKSYRIRPNATLEHIEELDNTILLSRYGARRGLAMSIAGNDAYRPQTKSKLFNFLDFGRDGQLHMLDKSKSMMTKLSSQTWSGNVLDELIEKPEQGLINIKALREGLKEATDENRAAVTAGTYNAASTYNQQVEILNSLYSKSTYKPNQLDAAKLSEQMTGEAKQYMELLTRSNDEMLESLIQMRGNRLGDTNHYANKDLASMLLKFTKDPRKTKNTISLKDGEEGALGANQSDTFFDLLRIELTKESLIKHAGDDYMSARSLINNTITDTRSKENLHQLTDWTYLQSFTGLYANKTGRESVDEILKQSEEVYNLFVKGKNKDHEFLEGMHQNLSRIRKEHVSDFETHYGESMKNADIVQAYGQDEFMHMKRMVGPMELIKNLNDETTRKAFLKQFGAGRDNMEDVTTGTLAPYFFLSRLSEALAPVGLSFSTENRGSVGSLATAMVLKRGLPIIGGMAAYDYTSDMFGVVTGQNLTTTMLSGVANADLGMRSLTDATGLTGAIQTAKDINPIARYLSGDDYMSREEREDWYQNGYEEMRKGRWWNFGGIQEYRGSKVQYYQPNYLRRATSNWKDNSLYDNVWEKWSHSLIPTPTNPISPLIYLADPYWMEKKFYNDRPYPMTGKMFTEETPWGPILNATVGELVKPQRRMHQDRLQGGLVDSLVLIEAENQQIYEKARNEESGHLVRFKDGAVEPVTYTDPMSPTPSTRLANIQNGQVTAGPSYGTYEGSTNAALVGVNNGALHPTPMVLTNAEGTKGETGFAPVEGLSFADEAAIQSAKGGILSGMFSDAVGTTSLANIESLNEQVRYRALANAQMESLGMPTGDGVISTESIYRAGGSFGSEVLKQGEAISELKGLASGDDFLGEMSYTLRFAAGIYGYGAFRAFPGGPSVKLADASDIDSPVRSFWDANLGGLGGGYLEIFRRFIPAFNHKQEDFNPLLNTMPDWMPEQYRLGDPYGKLPKGEMRMPGRGYESLHDLHPDAYGQYGAFDRFKILADIAPTSHEYKVWRSIAEKTTEDPHLKDEIEEIKERVEVQNKNHEFFDYKFLGRGTERENVVVDKVIDNNYFTAVGSERVYKLAGIQVAPKTKSGFVLGEAMASGSHITLITDKDEYSGINDDHYQSVSATVYMGGESLNRNLVEEDLAEKIGDASAAAAMGNYTDFQILRGKAWEALGHAPIPYFSQKFFKIRDPLESWKHEYTYGTSYGSWTNPIDTFLKPAIERGLMSDTEVAIGATAGLVNNYMQKAPDTFSPLMRNVATGAFALTSRGAFIGAFLGMAIEGEFSKNVRKAMNVGAIAQVGMWAFTRKDEMLEGTIGAAAIGAVIGNKFSNVGRTMGGAYGAIAGLAITSMNTNVLADGLNNEYIPERTKEKWELQEYFDRMNYMKYSGLYEKAARKAKRYEGVDVKALVDTYEKSQEENFKLRKHLEEAKEIVQRSYNATDSRGANLLNEIETKLSSLETQEFSISVGSFGKSAMAYKQAMDSTVYGLSENASWAEMVRAIPRNEREHFLEFFKEKNPKKQEEILKYVSPYTAKVLKIAWGQEPGKTESNDSYFQNHHLPGPFWSGWRPDVDLKNVQVKTIQNEGMLLADFGYYESQLRDPDVINAPNINPNSPNSTIGTMARITGTLRGMGLTGVNVNISPSSKSGVEVMANIASTVMSSPQAIENQIKQVLSF